MSDIEYEDIVNNNSDIKEVKDYLKNKFEISDYDFRNRLANHLLELDKFTKTEVLLGHADGYIDNILKNRRSKNNSVGKTDKSRVELKTRKKQVSVDKFKQKLIKVVAIAGAGIILYSSVSKIIDNTKENQKINDEVNKDISIITDGSTDKTIPSQNMYRVGTDNNNFPIIAYDESKMANDILKVALRNPDLLDVTLMHTYSNMENPLANMENVFKNMKLCLNDYNYFLGCYGEQLSQDIKGYYEQNKDKVLSLIGNGTFVDYLTKGNDSLKDIVKDYNSLYNDNDDKIVFNMLSNDNQKELLECIKNWLKQENNLNKEYVDSFNQLVNDTGMNQGGR